MEKKSILKKLRTIDVNDLEEAQIAESLIKNT